MYLLDANSFIESYNRYYALDICPGFWDWLDGMASSGSVRSVMPVYGELVGKGDALSDWVKSRRDDGRFLAVDDPATQAAFARVVRHVNAGRATQLAKGRFLAKADPLLIATAMVSGATVVTQEKEAPQATSSVKIPDVCRAFGVPCVNTFDLLRTRGAQFVLPAAADVFG
jgi:hypothetical protein